MLLMSMGAALGFPLLFRINRQLVSSFAVISPPGEDKLIMSVPPAAPFDDELTPAVSDDVDTELLTVLESPT